MEQTAKMMSDIVCPVVRSDVTCYWKDMWRRLDAMRRLWQLCDVRLCTDDGSTFMAHSPVLAASSDVLHRMLVASHAETFADGSGSIAIRNVAPDVLRVTLDFIYGVTPTSRADFERLRAGAAHLGIDGAYEYCCRRLDGSSKSGGILSPVIAADSDNQNSSEVQQRSAVNPVMLKVEIASSASDKYSSCGSAGSQTPRSRLHSDPQLPAVPVSAGSIQADTQFPPADFHHAEMMSQMSLDDLTRVDECPHFRRIVGDMLEDIPATIGAINQVGDDLDLDANSDLYDAVPLKKRYVKQHLSESTSCSTITSSPSRGINVSANNSILTSVPLSFESSFISRSLTSGGGLSNITPFETKLCPSQSGSDFQNVSKSFQVLPPQPAAADYDSWQNNGGDFIGNGLNSPNNLFLSSSTSCPKSMSSLLQNFEPPAFLPNSSLSPPSTDTRPTISSCLMAFESAQQESTYPFNSGLFSPDMSGIPSGFIPCSRISPPSDAKLRSFSAISGTDSLPLISNSVVWNDRYFSTGAVPTNVAAVPLSHASARPNSSFSMALTSAINLPKTSVADGPMAATTNQIVAAIPADVKLPMSMSAHSAAPSVCPHAGATSLCRDAGPSVCPYTEFDSGGFISLDDVSAVLKANGFAEKISTPLSVAVDRPEDRADGPQKENISVEGVINSGAVQVSTASTSRLCSLCLKKCKTERQLINHIRSAHANASDGTKSCASCAAVLPSVADLARHMESAHGRVVDNDLALALSRLNGNFCYYDGCTYQNPHADALQRHLHRRHAIGQPTLFCPTCNKSYFSIGQLNRHTSQAHSSRVVLPPAVDVADDGSVSSSSSVATATATAATLVHCDRSPGLSCPDCGETLSSPYKLQIHQLRMHNKGKLFTCHHCSFKSPRKKDVQAHMLSQHGTAPPGVRVYSCTLCNYKCIDKNRFEEHEAMHTGIPRYRCTLCPRVYTTRRGLRTHIKYHSSDRPHSCATCGASFKVRSKLADHIKLVHIQKGLKPYECGYCGHATALRGNCNQHIRKSHPGMALAVVDRLAAQRRTTKDYDYAGITGAGIEEHRDLRAAGWTESRAGLAL